MSVYSHLNSPSAWKLSRANRYVSARISFEGWTNDFGTLSSLHFRMRIKQVKPVRSHKIIFESQTGNPCALSTQIPYLAEQIGTLSPLFKHLWKLSRAKPVSFHNQNYFRKLSGKLPYALNTNLPFGS